MKKSILALAFALATAASWALPTTQQVEAAVKQGNYGQAETMMAEVVAAKPESARAHYVYAEVLAHNGSFVKAQDEVAKAREIDPAIKFASADKFRAFEQLLQRESAPRTAPAERSTTRSVDASPTAQMAQVAPTHVQAPAPAQSSGMPSWIWVVGLGVVGFFLWRGFNRSRSAAPAGAAAFGAPGAAMAGGAPVPYGSPGGPGAAPYGGAMPQQQPGMGSGMLGTGLAVAGGVAGGMMLDRMLRPGHDGAALASNNPGGNVGNPAGNFGNGNTPLDRAMPGSAGLDEAGRELESRDVDFGNGGNDWDAGGGSVDTGGSDTGGGWD